ncbi:hypothetical protein U1Q18_020695, partial [Sarracenia purpurea var. burkii]
MQNIVYYMRTNAACSRAVCAVIFQRIAARRIFKRLILGSQKAEAGWIRLQLLLIEKESAINVPMNLDARRRITFFTNSLFMNMPKAPKYVASPWFGVGIPWLVRLFSFWLQKDQCPVNPCSVKPCSVHAQALDFSSFGHG